ncbi:MAG: hypothetical protein L6Q60_11010 [Rhodocyclaceae bacterium]|nr:hypothetical protein [Rhodocyclaceae bacterium]
MTAFCRELTLPIAAQQSFVRFHQMLQWMNNQSLNQQRQRQYRNHKQ